MEGLTRDEFEETLAALARRRDDVERETEFLREIEADPLDIDDLKQSSARLISSSQPFPNVFQIGSDCKKESMKNMPRILFNLLLW